MEQLGKIIQNKDVSLQTKAKITHTLIFPIPMYGCKSRTVKKADGEKLLHWKYGFGREPYGKWIMRVKTEGSWKSSRPNEMG